MIPPPTTFNDWLADQINAILTSLEYLMTQSDRLSGGMATLAADLTTLADGIATEKQQLLDAINSGADLRAAVEAAITGLDSAHAMATSLSASLGSDDPPPPAA